MTDDTKLRELELKATTGTNWSGMLTSNEVLNLIHDIRELQHENNELRARLERKNEYLNASTEELAEHIDKLKAENERLTAALRKATNGLTDSGNVVHAKAVTSWRD